MVTEATVTKMTVTAPAPRLRLWEILVFQNAESEREDDRQFQLDHSEQTVAPTERHIDHRK